MMGGLRINKTLIVLTIVLQCQVVLSAISWDSGCGSTKGCFPNCPDGCDYLVTWIDTGANIQFTLQAEESDTSVYLAIGFSDDRRMGADSVVGCIVPGATVYSYYNEGTETEEHSPLTLGLTSTSVSQTNGVISCSFTRSYNENNDQFVNLKDDYSLMLVIGEAEEDDGSYKMGHHYMIPWMSDGKVDFNSHTIVDLYKLNSPRVKLHGIMMILAWLLLVTIGTITARYNKDMLPEQKLFGTKVWFQLHRGLMVAVLVFTIIGFIPIFVEIQGYCQLTPPKSENPVKAHPVFGIIVTVLCIINPFMTLFRCGPDHKLRWLFDWAHFLVGIVAQVFAVITIILGYILERAMLPKSVIWITIVHLVVVVVVSVIMEVHKWMAKKKNKKIEGVTEEKEMKEEKSEPKLSKLPFILLVVLAVVLFIFAITILAIIAAS